MYKGESMATTLGDVINNIRYIWQQMKNDTSIKDAVYMYYTTTGVMVLLPLICAAFIVYHKAYTLFPHTTSLFVIGIVVLALIGLGIYSGMTQVFTAS